MAEKKAAGKEVKEEEPAAEGAGKRKKLILIAAGGVLVLVLSIVLGVVLFGGKGEDEGEEVAAEEAVHAPPALYVALGQKIIVTLPGAGKPHHLQVSISALTREQAVVDELNFNAPLLRDRLTSLLARQEFDTLRTEEGKLALRDEALKTVQGIVAEALEQSAASVPKGEDEEDEAEEKPKDKKKGEDAHGDEPHAAGVEQIFFTEFVLQ